MTRLEHRFYEASKDAGIARMEASQHPDSAHYARRADRRCRVAYALEELVWQERIAIAYSTPPYKRRYKRR